MEKIRKALDLARGERERRLAAGATELEATPALRRDVPGIAGGAAAASSTAPGEPAVAHAFVPDAASLEAHRIVLPSSRSPAGEAFRILRTQVLQRMSQHGWRTLAITSADRDAGRTTAAINLAAAIGADPRHSALLVDLDLRDPGVAAGFGLTPALGVEDALAGRSRVDQCLLRPEGFERLTLLPARGGDAGSANYLAGPAVQQLVAELRMRYTDRIVIFDVPPVLNQDDALAFAPLVDCALVVVAEGGTRRDDLVRCMELLRDTPVLGTALNKAHDAGRSEA